jgi:ATP-dependent DNA helicase RecG
MENAGSPAPVFEIIADNFKVTLFPIGEMSDGGVSGGVSGGVNGGVNDLLNFIKANPGKKSKEIRAALNLPQRTLERWLKELRDQKKIKFHGPPKTGGYYFLDETDPDTQPPL